MPRRTIAPSRASTSALLSEHTYGHPHTSSHFTAARARCGQLLDGHVTGWLMHRTSSSKLRALRQISDPPTAGSSPAPPPPLCQNALPDSAGTLLAACLYLARPTAATSARRHMPRSLSYFLSGATALSLPRISHHQAGRPPRVTDATARHSLKLSFGSLRRAC